MTTEERRQRQEARKKLAEERTAARKADEDLVLEAVRGILRDDRATPTERLYAVCIMDRLKYYNLCPSDVPFKEKPDALARLRERFKAELADNQAATSDR